VSRVVVAVVVRTTFLILRIDIFQCAWRKILLVLVPVALDLSEHINVIEDAAYSACVSSQRVTIRSSSPGLQFGRNIIIK